MTLRTFILGALAATSRALAGEQTPSQETIAAERIAAEITYDLSDLRPPIPPQTCDIINNRASCNDYEPRYMNPQKAENFLRFGEACFGNCADREPTVTTTNKPRP